jgi:hypothetical protein
MMIPNSSMATMFSRNFNGVKAKTRGRPLMQWFVYLLVISLFYAYVAGGALSAGAPYMGVFRFVGVVAFMAYGLGHAHQSIWYGQKWSTTGNYFIDGLIYALLTAGVFGWLWPR